MYAVPVAAADDAAGVLHRDAAHQTPALQDSSMVKKQEAMMRKVSLENSDDEGRCDDSYCQHLMDYLSIVTHTLVFNQSCPGAEEAMLLSQHVVVLTSGHYRDQPTHRKTKHPKGKCILAVNDFCIAFTDA